MRNIAVQRPRAVRWCHAGWSAAATGPPQTGGAPRTAAAHKPLAHHAVAIIALGFGRIWLRGDDEVRRGCNETGACLFGYFTEKPRYDAWAPQLRVGYGLFAPAPDTKLGGTLELIVEPMFYPNVPPDGAHGIAVFAAFTGTVGGGRDD